MPAEEQLRAIGDQFWIDFEPMQTDVESRACRILYEVVDYAYSEGRLREEVRTIKIESLGGD